MGWGTRPLAPPGAPPLPPLPSPFPTPPVPLQPGLPVEFSAQLQYLLQMLGALLRIFLAVVAPAIAVGFAEYRWLKYIWPERLRESPAFDLAVIIGTLSLYMLSAGVLVFFNPLWQILYGTPFVDVKFFTDGNFPTVDVGLVLRLAAAFGMFAAAANAIGWWWNRRKWLIASAIFIGIGVTLFTTVFTNGVGLGTGFVGSLGYWLEQQGVARGDQPFYYYFVVTPIYEYLPIVVSLIATASTPGAGGGIDRRRTRSRGTSACSCRLRSGGSWRRG